MNESIQINEYVTKKACTRVILLLAGTLLLAASPSLRAELVFDVSLTQTNFVVGEPVILHLALRNSGTDAIIVRSDLELETQVVKVVVEPPDGEPYRFATGRIRDPRGIVTLQPGDSLKQSHDIRLRRMAALAGSDSMNDAPYITISVNVMASTISS